MPHPEARPFTHLRRKTLVSLEKTIFNLNLGDWLMSMFGHRKIWTFGYESSFILVSPLFFKGKCIKKKHHAECEAVKKKVR
jgi:hypothetical protein